MEITYRWSVVHGVYIVEPEMSFWDTADEARARIAFLKSYLD